MKKISLITLCLLATLSLGFALNISAQENARTEKAKGNTPLATSLDQLGQELKQSTAIRLNQWTGSRKTYVRLKHSGGCDISFQVSHVPSVIYADNRRSVDLEYGN